MINTNTIKATDAGNQARKLKKNPTKLRPLKIRKSAATVHVVPSGQVYKQIFDAEVQLVKALHKTQEDRVSRENSKLSECGANRNFFNANNSGSTGQIPLIQNNLGAFLTERQKSWMNALPNDGVTENPILYKRSLKSEEVLATATSSEERRRVRGLPDALPPIPDAGAGDGISAKIAASRKERHEAAVEDMRQDLAAISAEVEPQVTTAGEDLMSFLTENDHLIEGFLVRIDDDEELMSLQLSDILQVWEEVEKQSEIRRQAIEKLDAMLQKLETERIAKIRDIFTNFSGILQGIAHLMPDDVSRILDQESQIINGTVVNNKRAYADLYSRLMTADIEREKYQHRLWQKRMEDWRRAKMAASVAEFAEFVAADDIVNPPGVAEVLSRMFEDQREHRAKQMAVMNELITFRPPNTTKQKIYDWHETLLSLNKEMDILNQKYLQELHKEYEKVCQKCLEEVARIEASWRAMGITDEDAMRTTVEEELLPVIGEKQKALEKVLEDMDKKFEEHVAAQENEIKELFSYAQGTANAWDNHEVALTRAERQLVEKLESTRKEHEGANQDKEAHLDQQLDRLRQEATEAALTENLKIVCSILEKIKECYETFHIGQMELVQAYPAACQKELDKYEGDVTSFFGLSRKSPLEIAQEKRDAEIAAAAPQESPDGTAETNPLGTLDRSELMLEHIILETITTAKGHLFYILGEAPKREVSETGSRTSKTPGASVDSRRSSTVAASASKVGSKSSAKEAEGDGATLVDEKVSEEEDEAPDLSPDVAAAIEIASHVLDNVIITTNEYEDLRKRLRQGFLDHLDNWPTEAIERSNTIVASKIEELNSELDLKLHLHEPRFKRAEVDVHHVRAAELVLHQERVTRHSKGVANALADIKVQFNDLTQEHQKIVDQFKVNIDNLESVFVEATKSSKLVALQNQLQNLQIKFMNQIRTSLREYRKKLDETLQRMRESNAKFVRSFKLFSDGGNYCPEEIEDFRKKLEKLTQRINQTETSVMADLEGLEGRRQEQISDIVSKFEDRFKHHTVDLLFIEKLGRWITNTQVKIKSEVAHSNRQSQKLHESLSTLTRRIDACKNPNMDKEFVPPNVLVQSLSPIFTDFRDRVAYLNCLLSPPPPAAGRSSIATANQAGLASAAESRGESRQSATAVTTGNSAVEAQITPAAGLALVKNMLGGKGVGFRLDVDKDDELSPHLPPPNHYSPANANRASPHRDKATPQPPTDDGSKQFNSKGGSKIDRKYLLFGPNDALSGTDPSVDPNTHFLGIVSRILQEAQEGLLATADAFYRQKGSRTITRPNAIQENFDQCAEVITGKLQNYYDQAKSYHNSCVLDLREQLISFENSVSEIPSLSVGDVRRRRAEVLRKRLQRLQTAWGQQAHHLEQERLRHHRTLRPNLGHPHLKPELQALVEAEEERKGKMAEGLEESIDQIKSLLMESAEAFVSELSAKAQELLFLFDEQVTVDEVYQGKVEPEKLETAELLRRRAAGEALQRETKTTTMSRGPGTWKGIPERELVDRVQFGPPSVPNASAAAPVKPGLGPTSAVGVVPNDGDSPRKLGPERDDPESKMDIGAEAEGGEDAEGALSTSLHTAKRTIGHEATIAARDKAYEEFKEWFLNTLASVEDSNSTSTSESRRWNRSWAQSVMQIQKLYQEVPSIILTVAPSASQEAPPTPKTAAGAEGLEDVTENRAIGD